MMFTTWWADGSQGEVFYQSEVEKFAEKYSFSSSDLLYFREVFFKDESEIVGGVIEI
tara:strand:- start:2720 stop:2890 length:171 start_codon:yes stop_codon:yes gene_type:complete